MKTNRFSISEILMFVEFNSAKMVFSSIHSPYNGEGIEQFYLESQDFRNKINTISKWYGKRMFKNKSLNNKKYSEKTSKKMYSLTKIFLREYIDHSK